jgi:hypothetical protein
MRDSDCYIWMKSLALFRFLDDDECYPSCGFVDIIVKFLPRWLVMVHHGVLGSARSMPATPKHRTNLHGSRRAEASRQVGQTGRDGTGRVGLAGLVSVILFLVEQICTGGAKVDDLGTAVAVLLKAGALEAVEGVGDALATAHHALVLVVAEAALVADAH